MDGLVKNLNSGARRKASDGTLRKREEKSKKYADTDPHLHFLKQKPRPCNHDSKNLKCLTVSYPDISLSRLYLYQADGKERQDLVLTRFISAFPPKRTGRGGGKGGPSKPKNVSLKYFLLKSPKKVATPVCKKFFCFALGISPARAVRLGKLIGEGTVPKEKRGGDRKAIKFSAKRQFVRDFLGNLKCTESHYGCGKSKRVYLSADLSIRKLYRLYILQAPTEMHVSLTFFHRIFLRDFNIGFSSPACDVCATCTRLKNEIASASEKEKPKLIGELRIHKVRAKCFYTMMKEADANEDAVTFIIDLQQVQPLPKTPIGEAFYRRQIAFYSFCCVSYSSRDPTFFTWNEVEGKRGSNEIGSAVLCHLRGIQFSPNITSVQIFCDGCGGQNKNAHMVHALSYWLKKEAPEHVQEVQLTFPVRGHSFLPADRAFGRVGKQLKKVPVITSSEEYNKIYRDFGSVRSLVDDWTVYDLKDLLNFYQKIGGIRDAKRVVIRKFLSRSKAVCTKVRCLLNYRFDSSTEQFRSIVKKGRKEENLPPLTQLPKQNGLTREKKRDVLQLLEQHFGSNWRELQELRWFRGACEGAEDIPEEDPSAELVCECIDEDPIPTHM